MQKIISYSIVSILIMAGLWWYASHHADASVVRPEGRLVIEPIEPSPDDPVVITVNGEPITRSEFEQAFASVPENMRQNLANPAGRKALGEELVRLTLLEQEARRRELQDDPELRRRINLVVRNMLASAALSDLVEESAGDVEALYQENIEQFQTAEAKQILVAYDGGIVPPREGEAPSREEAVRQAEELLAQLRQGADFEQLATGHSDDPSAERGGAIGSFGRAAVPEVIGDAVFVLEAGDLSEVVVSDYGVHIFKLTSKRTRPLEEVREVITQRGDQLRMRQITEKLRETAVVEFEEEYFATPRRLR